MTKWFKPLLLSTILCSPVVMAGFDCEDMQSKTFHEQKTQFRQAREDFIGQMQLHIYAKKVINVLRHSSADDMPNSLYVSDIPKKIAEFKYQLDAPEEGWEKRLDFWKNAAGELEEMARCYHFGYLGDDNKEPLMLIKLYDNGDEKPVIAGYRTTARDGSPSKIIAYTKVEESCSERKCGFTDTFLKEMDFSQFTAIRLTHHPEATPKAADNLTDKPHGLPKVSYLTGLKLEKTGELFTDPEIMMTVAYTGGTGEHRTSVVDIPWAVTADKLNKGRTLLFNWEDFSQASVIFYEDDLDIPYGKIVKIMAAGIKLTLSLVPAATPALSIIEGVKEALKNKEVDGDTSLITYMDGLGENDLIGEIVITREKLRNQQDSVLTTVKSQATLHLHHMYLPAESDTDSAGASTKDENPASAEEKDPAAVAGDATNKPTENTIDSSEPTPAKKTTDRTEPAEDDDVRAHADTKPTEGVDTGPDGGTDEPELDIHSKEGQDKKEDPYKEEL